MGTKLPPQQLNLYFALDRILLNDWDPIGVSNIKGAENEYHSYLPRVFSMVMANSSAKEIAEYLNLVVSERMGLNSHPEHSINIAEQCILAKSQAGLSV